MSDKEDQDLEVGHLREDVEVPEWKKPHFYTCLWLEFLGTMLFALIGGLCVQQSQGIIKSPDGTTIYGKTPGGLVSAALGNGISLGLLIAITAPVSGGNLNPAVSFGLMIVGKAAGGLSVIKGCAYIFVQLVGSIVGAAILRFLIYAEANKYLAPEGRTASLFVHQGTLTRGGGTFAGLVAELVGTFLLVHLVMTLCVFPANVKGKRDFQNVPNYMAPLMIGLSVTCMVCGIGQLTGCAINPSRSFGVAVVFNDFTGLQVYWVGQFLGGALAAINVLVMYKSQLKHNKTA